MAQSSIHRGSYESIPSTATPGMLWIKEFLTIIDAVDDGVNAGLTSYVKPDARFMWNNQEASTITTDAVVSTLAQRNQAVASFHHEVSSVFDVPGEGDARTVILESVANITAKGGGPTKRAPDVCVIELVKDADGSLKGTELRTYVDNSPQDQA